jgi:hypothetical protein
MDEQQKPPVTPVSYKQGISARSLQRQEDRKGKGAFPNIAQASVEYDPKQGARTMVQIAEEQRAVAAGTATKETGISPGTIEGLKALKVAQDAQQPTAAATAGPAALVEDLPPQDAESLEMLEVLKSLNRDILANEKEREAVEARLKPIDISEGLMTGSFTQEVPIVPDRLVVSYRSMTTLDHYEINAKVYLKLRERPEYERVSGLLVGLYQTVATVARLNGTSFPAHIKREGGKTVFDEAVFDQKLQDFMMYPLPLIGSLGVHGQWFDNRVRKLFTTASIKNG